MPVVDLVRRVQHHQLRRIKFERAFGHHPLNALFLGQQRAVRKAFLRAVDEHLERLLDLAEPAHAVRESRGAEPHLAEFVAAAAFAQHVRLRHAHVRVADFRMTAAAAHRLHVADDFETRVRSAAR